MSLCRAGLADRRNHHRGSHTQAAKRSGCITQTRRVKILQQPIAMNHNLYLIWRKLLGHDRCKVANGTQSYSYANTSLAVSGRGPPWRRQILMLLNIQNGPVSRERIDDTLPFHTCQCHAFRLLPTTPNTHETNVLPSAASASWHEIAKSMRTTQHACPKNTAQWVISQRVLLQPIVENTQPAHAICVCWNTSSMLVRCLKALCL